MTGDHCPCIATSHPHKPGDCDEPEAPQGGICPTCRWYAMRDEE